MKIAILGCGVMGSAFARQFAKKGYQLVLCDRNPEKAEVLAEEISGQHIPELPISAAKVDIVLLAVKPKELEELAKQVGSLHGKIILSVLAQTSVERLKKHFPKAQIVRCMPNLALSCGESVIALVDDKSLSFNVKRAVEEMLEGMGLIFWVEEEKIDAITALAGSGPAYIIAIVEAMVESGIAMGLRADEALQLSLQAMKGAVALIKEHAGHPGGIRWQISSPSGTTIAGMKVFEENGVRSGLIKTFLAAFQRSQEII